MKIDKTKIIHRFGNSYCLICRAITESTAYYLGKEIIIKCNLCASLKFHNDSRPAMGREEKKGRHED